MHSALAKSLPRNSTALSSDEVADLNILPGVCSLYVEGRVIKLSKGTFGLSVLFSSVVCVCLYIHSFADSFSLSPPSSLHSLLSRGHGWLT